MKSPDSRKRGFTIMELIVVLAVIVIFGAILLQWLISARGQAQVAEALQTMKTLQGAALICLNESTAINIPTETNTGGGQYICDGNPPQYLTLPSGWIYCDAFSSVQNDANCGNDVFEQIVGDRFEIRAESHDRGYVIVCTESACSAVEDSN